MTKPICCACLKKPGLHYAGKQAFFLNLKNGNRCIFDQQIPETDFIVKQT